MTVVYPNSMLNVLLLETMSVFPRHIDTSEFFVFIYGSAIERFHDKQGNDLEMVVMKAGSNKNIICMHL